MTSKPFALIQLSIRVRVSNPNGKFEKKLVNCRNNCQLGLGLGLVTLILSSVVNPDTNPDPNPKRTCKKNGLMTVAVRFNTNDYCALFETCLGTEPVQTGFM